MHAPGFHLLRLPTGSDGLKICGTSCVTTMGISYVCKYAERAYLCNHSSHCRSSLHNHSIPSAIEWMVSLFVLVTEDIRTTMVLQIRLYCTTHWPEYKFGISSPAPTIIIATPMTPDKGDWSDVHSIHSLSQMLQMTWWKCEPRSTTKNLFWFFGLSQHESMLFSSRPR